MNTMSKYLLILPCLLVLGATTPTYAEDKGAQYKPFYIQIIAGQIEDGDGLEADAYGLAFGWQPSPYASLEVAYNYHDYDDFTARGMPGEASGNRIQLAVVATPVIFPIRPIALVGVARSEAEVTNRITNASVTVKDTAAVYGAGIDFDFTEDFGGRLIYKKVAGDFEDDGFFLGATFRF